MDEVMIERWNEKVSPGDWVYHLGDFSFKDPQDYVKRLNGRIILILGNHDRKRLSALKECFGCVHELLTIKEKGKDIVLCHYAMRVWPKAHFNSWHLYGHSHGKLEPMGKSFDVGVDCTGFAPININTVEAVMVARSDNPSLIRKI